MFIQLFDSQCPLSEVATQEASCCKAFEGNRVQQSGFSGGCLTPTMISYGIVARLGSWAECRGT